MQYNSKDIEGFHQKDKRISFLSIFSSLAHLYQGGKLDANEIAEMANKINNRLYINYPFPKETIMQATLTDNCDCGVPRVYKEGIKNGKKWRGQFCANKVCKPVWLPKGITPAEENKIKAQDQQFDELRAESQLEEMPQEYGG